jgi:hypothetical protein
MAADGHDRRLVGATVADAPSDPRVGWLKETCAGRPIAAPPQSDPLRASIMPGCLTLMPTTTPGHPP